MHLCCNCEHCSQLAIVGHWSMMWEHPFYICVQKLRHPDVVHLWLGGLSLLHQSLTVCQASIILRNLPSTSQSRAVILGFVVFVVFVGFFFFIVSSATEAFGISYVGCPLSIVA